MWSVLYAEKWDILAVCRSGRRQQGAAFGYNPGGVRISGHKGAGLNSVMGGDACF